MGSSSKEGSSVQDYLYIPRPDQTLPSGTLTGFIMYPTRKNNARMFVLRPSGNGGYDSVQNVNYSPTQTESPEMITLDQGIEVSLLLLLFLLPSY